MFHESVREADVYIVATASSAETGTNGALMECGASFLLLSRRVADFFPQALHHGAHAEDCVGEKDYGGRVGLFL